MTSIYIRKNEYEKAYKLFSEIFSKRKDWFLIKDLGDMYFQKKEYDQAMYYYICAALAKGNILNKIQLYHKLGETLEILGFDGEDHFQLAYKIRKKMDWEPELIENKLKNINDQRTIEEVNIELKSFWLRHLEHGEIVKLFKNNLYGFIKSQDKEYIFKFIFLNLHPDKLKLNAKVKFAKLPSYDFKTKKFTFEAFYIELI
jgi:tetratricopeptide (TPR) repeat protein